MTLYFNSDYENFEKISGMYRVNLYFANTEFHKLHKWCEENCIREWTTLFNMKGQYVYYFKHRNDAVAFMLRWA